jgi:flagellin
MVFPPNKQTNTRVVISISQKHGLTHQLFAFAAFFLYTWVLRPYHGRINIAQKVNQIMVNSVNTNASAGLGLRTLQRTSNSLSATQNRVSTGEKVSSSKVNAAVLNVARQLMGNIGGLNAVKSSLSRAISVTDVAAAAGQEISNLLITLRQKAVAASDTGLDANSRAALNQEFTAIRDSINNIASSASFNGTNALAGDQVTAIINTDGSQNITIPAQNFSLGGGTVTLTSGDNIGTAAEASAAVAAVDASLSNVGQGLSVLGTGARQIEQQNEFTSKLSDTIEQGVGGLVDANLGQESANLVADQVRLQLGLKAQAIANRAPTTILALF